MGQTGKSLEIKNKLGVKAKRLGKEKLTYYPKQYYHYIGYLGKQLSAQENKYWYRKMKTSQYAFSVTYPKSKQDIVVGIGFASTDSGKSEMQESSFGYWDGQCSFGKSNYYKYGKKTISYIRLDQ